jgi:L-Ala-D/L-Glu epimerase / N-acetyl-D-glutamate racemase
MALSVAQRAVELTLAQPLVVSRGAHASAEVVHVAVTSGDTVGFGEAAPLEHFGESVASVQEFVDAHADLLGDDPFALEDISARLAEVPGNHAAKAALDAALHDLQGKLLNISVRRLLGLRRLGPATAWTLSLDDPDAMARAAQAAGDRFAAIKLKVGGRDGLDVERVRAVRGVTELPLSVDTNEAWSLDEALDVLAQMAELGVSYCEQPLPERDPDGPALRERSPVPIFADEDCHTLADVARCAQIAHGINIKLAKSGGIREAIRMAHAARALGLGVMVGCMMESGLGIAAGCVLATLCDHVDLDGNLLLSEDPCPGVRLEGGVQTPSDAPGLGVHVEPDV